VRDNQSTSWDTFQRIGQPLVATPANQSDHVELWYASNVSAGQTTVTVSFSAPPAYSTDAHTVGIYEYAGLNHLSPLAQIVEAIGVGNMPDAGRLPAPYLHTGLYFVVGGDGGPNLSVGNDITPVQAGVGFTLEDQQDNPDFERFYTEDRIGTEATNASFSLTYPANWGVICVLFVS